MRQAELSNDIRIIPSILYFSSEAKLKCSYYFQMKDLSLDFVVQELCVAEFICAIVYSASHVYKIINNIRLLG